MQIPSLATDDSTPPAPLLGETEELYLSLLKNVLTRTGFTSYSMPNPRGWRKALLGPLQVLFRAQGFEILKRGNPQKREQGLDWPVDAETMVGLKRLDNLQHCVVQVLKAGVPGDLIETGVWRGGASIFMRAILKACNCADRTVWVADSFKGLPKPGPLARKGDEIFWQYPELAVSLDLVRQNFARYQMLDDRVRFLEGWFAETLPSAPIEQLALMRLDGDMYESTKDALEALYPKLSVGGFVIVDDYGVVDGCREAIDEFRAGQSISDEIRVIDECGIYWQRTDKQAS